MIFLSIVSLTVLYECNAKSVKYSFKGFAHSWWIHTSDFSCFVWLNVLSWLCGRVQFLPRHSWCHIITIIAPRSFNLSRGLISESNWKHQSDTLKGAFPSCHNYEQPSGKSCSCQSRTLFWVRDIRNLCQLQYVQLGRSTKCQQNGCQNVYKSATLDSSINLGIIGLNKYTSRIENKMRFFRQCVHTCFFPSKNRQTYD